jgi:hypothetical protein
MAKTFIFVYLSQKPQDSGKIYGHKFLCTTSVENISHSDKYLVSYLHVTLQMHAKTQGGLHVKEILVMSHFNQNLSIKK